MKTTTTSTRKNNKKGRIIVTLIGKCLLLFLLLSTSNSSFAQSAAKIKTGLSFLSQVSANGYGGASVPMLYVRNGQRALSAGPVINNRKWIVSGIQVNYTYSLTGPEIKGHEACEIELYTFIDAAYHFNGYLGKRTLWEENSINASSIENNIAGHRFKCIELFAGAGIRVPFLKRFKWAGAMGLGVYQSLDFPDKLQLYYESRNVGLIVRTGISMDIL